MSAAGKEHSKDGLYTKRRMLQDLWHLNRRLGKGASLRVLHAGFVAA